MAVAEPELLNQNFSSCARKSTRLRLSLQLHVRKWLSGFTPITVRLAIVAPDGCYLLWQVVRSATNRVCALRIFVLNQAVTPSVAETLPRSSQIVSLLSLGDDSSSFDNLHIILILFLSFSYYSYHSRTLIVF